MTVFDNRNDDDGTADGDRDENNSDGHDTYGTHDAHGVANDGTTDEASDPIEPATIAVENCSLSFGDLSVLEDVSLTVEPGEFVGFVGPNGAGKTTLLRLISGALEPDSGRITIDGVDVHAVDSRTSSRLVSVVPQDTTLSFSFPVRDVVEMGRHPHRSRFSSPTRADQEVVDDALERTRTAELADRPIDEVSGGQRQRVVLARAIAQATPAMLLDEPTASLDVNHQLETLELVRELVDDGRTVCAAIHDLDLAARYCDRLVMLADGAVYRSGPPSEVLSGDALSDVFDATATVTQNPITGTETVTALPTPVGVGLGGEGPATAESATEHGGDVEDGDAATADHRVHVLGTGPTATSALARLEREPGLALSVGPVVATETTAETARSLGIEPLEVAPFESLSPAELTAFEERVRDANVTVVTEGVFESGGMGTESLLETVDDVADAVVVATQDEDRDGKAAIAAAGDSAVWTATPETILEAVADALETGIDGQSTVIGAEPGPGLETESSAGAAEEETRSTATDGGSDSSVVGGSSSGSDSNSNSTLR
ncbi:heme ABC transporter ATP-binding protein [Natronolimnohabitans innermongolicus]|uniref:Cobalamin import ATP-binding protein BtuD n=1 Tax=Natronolimnohabitans innermongolicus JCM 12255 TaxID=1227499 RepID=L9XKD7_9EURY|nr:heme ABC transporter ATP-binding protein [Natronolimnohabitans innermongolicus]ELY62200.1 ABC transporter [Natronolimnohabitans innermongolicus JCM 12255]